MNISQYKKTNAKIILFSVVTFLLVFATLTFFVVSKNSNKEKLWETNQQALYDYAKKTSQETIIEDFSKWTPFKWDKLYCFNSKTSKNVIYGTIGYKWAKIPDSTGITMYRIVFTNKGKVVCFFDINFDTTDIIFDMGGFDESYIQISSKEKPSFFINKKRNGTTTLVYSKAFNKETPFYDTSKFTSFNMQKNIAISGYEELSETVFISWINPQIWVDLWSVKFIPELENSNHVLISIDINSSILSITLEKYISGELIEGFTGAPAGPTLHYDYDFKKNQILNLEYCDFNNFNIDKISEKQLLEISKQLKDIVDNSLAVYELNEEIINYDDTYNVKTKTIEE